MEYGIDGFNPGLWWELRLDLLEKLEEFRREEKSKARMPVETENVEKRAVEILNAERRRVRRNLINEYGSEENAAKEILLLALDPDAMLEPRFAGRVERWSWSACNPLSDYADDLKEIKTALHEGREIHWSWLPPKTRENAVPAWLSEPETLEEAEYSIAHFDDAFKEYQSVRDTPADWPKYPERHGIGGEMSPEDWLKGFNDALSCLDQIEPETERLKEARFNPGYLQDQGVWSPHGKSIENLDWIPSG